MKKVLLIVLVLCAVSLGGLIWVKTRPECEEKMSRFQAIAATGISEKLANLNDPLVQFKIDNITDKAVDDALHTCWDEKNYPRAIIVGEYRLKIQGLKVYYEKNQTMRDAQMDLLGAEYELMSSLYGEAGDQAKAQEAHANAVMAKDHKIKITRP